MGLFAKLKTALGAPESDELARLRIQYRHLDERLHKVTQRVEELAAQVERLDGRQVERELALRELSDKMLRYLKRVEEVERRETQRSEGQGGTAELLRSLKFGRK